LNPLLTFTIRNDVETVIHSDNDFATVAYLRIKSASLEPKQQILPIDVHAPPLIDEDHQVIEDAVLQFQKDRPNNGIRAQESLIRGFDVLTETCGHQLQGWIAVTNVQVGHKDNRSLEDEVRGCFDLLESESIVLESRKPIHSFKSASRPTGSVFRKVQISISFYHPWISSLG
jgi:diphthine-ammonia ligase